MTEGLEFVPLFDEDFLALLPKNHPLADTAHITWQKLFANPFITLQKPSIVRHLVEQNCLRNNMTLDLKIECHQISSLSSFVAHGIGVSAIPRHFAKHIDLTENVLLELEDGTIHKTVGIVYKKNFEISHISAQFIESLIRYKF